MRHRSPLCFCLSSALALFVALVPSSALAGGLTVQLEPVKDNTLYEDGGDVSNGAGEYLFAGQTANTNNNLLRRAVLAFSLTGNIPSDAVITSVTLDMTMSMSIVGEANVALHRLTADWGEGTSDAPGQEGRGTDATSGDATWLNTFFGGGTWTTAGGDFAPTASATVGVAGNDTYTWGTTSALVADVQAWVDNPSSNYGWIVLGDETLPPPTTKRFNSRENGTAEERPSLTVNFTSPGLIFIDGFESGDTAAWTNLIQQ